LVPSDTTCVQKAFPAPVLDPNQRRRRRHVESATTTTTTTMGADTARTEPIQRSLRQLGSSGRCSAGTNDMPSEPRPSRPAEGIREGHCGRAAFRAPRRLCSPRRPPSSLLLFCRSCKVHCLPCPARVKASRRGSRGRRWRSMVGRRLRSCRRRRRRALMTLMIVPTRRALFSSACDGAENEDPAKAPACAGPFRQSNPVTCL
jgi:hypothetical protein